MFMRDFTIKIVLKTDFKLHITELNHSCNLFIKVLFYYLTFPGMKEWEQDKSLWKLRIERTLFLLISAQILQKENNLNVY